MCLSDSPETGAATAVIRRRIVHVPRGRWSIRMHTAMTTCLIARSGIVAGKDGAGSWHCGRRLHQMPWTVTPHQLPPFDVTRDEESGRSHGHLLFFFLFSGNTLAHVQCVPAYHGMTRSTGQLAHPHRC